MTTLPTHPTLDKLRPMATLHEYRFRSQVPLIGPLIARFREIWNSVSTKWYVRPLIEQQSEINQQIVSALVVQAAALRDVASRLAMDEERLVSNEVRVGQQEARLHAHDGWLIEQDREQSAANGDLSETTLRLIQTNRRLADLEHRLAMLDTSLTSPAAEQKP
jgi:hypothetical protein